MSSALLGKRVLVTRPKHHAGKLVQKLTQKGAIPILLPAIEIVEPLEVVLLDQAIQRLNEFDWIIFTSVNGVDAVAKRVAHLNLRFSDLPEIKIAVVGPATSEALAAVWRAPDAMPAEFISDEIAGIIPDLAGSRILLPRGDLARPELSEALSSLGATILDVTAYRIVSQVGNWEHNTDDVPDAITVMSGESARATINQLRESGLDDWLERVPIVCIGPVTAASVVDEGITPATVAGEHTIDGLLKALEEMFDRGLSSA